MTAAPMAIERHARMIRILNSERWAMIDIGSEPLIAVFEKRQATTCPL
jgi:hypothetical protein